MIQDSMENLPTVLSCNKTIVFKDQVTQIQLEKKIDQFLLYMLKDLRLKGCRLIGHIKGLIATDDNGHLMFSVTRFNEKAEFKGEISQAVKNAKFTINVIVYEIDQIVVNKVFKKAYNNFFR